MRPVDAMCVCLGFDIIVCVFCFFFNDTATTEIYTLSLHDALPICWFKPPQCQCSGTNRPRLHWILRSEEHTSELQSRGLISYAVFCLKKQKPYPSAQPRARTSTLPSLPPLHKTP